VRSLYLLIVDVPVCGKVTPVILHGIGDNVPRAVSYERGTPVQAPCHREPVWLAFNSALLKHVESLEGHVKVSWR